VDFHFVNKYAMKLILWPLHLNISELTSLPMTEYIGSSNGRDGWWWETKP